MSLFKNFHLPAWLFAGVLLLFAGCGGSDDDSLIVVRLDAETVNCNTTSNRIIAVGDAMTFVATILSQDVGDAWEDGIPCIPLYRCLPVFRLRRLPSAVV